MHSSFLLLDEALFISDVKHHRSQLGNRFRKSVREPVVFTACPAPSSTLSATDFDLYSLKCCISNFRGIQAVASGRPEPRCQFHQCALLSGPSMW
jgi:hypothetical protein